MASRMQMQQTLIDSVPMVVQAITTSITQPREAISTHQLDSALKCLVAWVPTLPGKWALLSDICYQCLMLLWTSDLTPLIPLLISLLTPISSEFDESFFVPTSDALQEIMSKSALSYGSGSKTLTEPVLIWLDLWAGRIVESTLSCTSCYPWIPKTEISNISLISGLRWWRISFSVQITGCHRRSLNIISFGQPDHSISSC